MKRGILVLWLLCVGSGLWGQNPTFFKETEKFLREFPVRLETGEATPQDFQVCQNLWKMAPNEDAKRPFLLLAAQYQRKILHNPAQGMLLLLPSLLGEAEAKVWEQENLAEARKNASPKEKGTSGKTIWTPLPPVDMWTIHEKNAMLAVEVANGLLDEGDVSFALTIIDEVGQNYSDESRVLAAETGADIYVRMKMHDRAVEFYTFGLKVLGTLKKTEYEQGKGDRVFFSEEQKILQARLEKKLSQTKKILDEERYGPDWVAYREAQEKHFAKDYLTAYVLYGRVVEKYPDSIYAEASRCYRIVLLTKFADVTNLEKVPEKLKTRQKELAALRQKWFASQKSKNAELTEKYHSRMDEITTFLAIIQKLPTGQKALEQAEKEAENFISTDETGLYRGEVMLEIGLCWLNVFIEPDKAEKWLERACDWFKNVKKLDGELTKFQVPEQSAEISQPPKEERFTDDWMNTNNSQPKPGDLFNRRECTWYWGSKQKEAVTMLGLIAYAKRDFPKAKETWTSLYLLDTYFKDQDDHGIAMSYVKRLLWNIDNNDGALFATPEEMKAFQDTQSRWMLLNADIELELQNYPAAEEKFRKLLKKPSIRSHREQAAYCTFALATALLMQNNRKESFSLYERFMPREILGGTVSASRALMFYANHATQNIYRRKDVERGVQIYEYLYRSLPNTEIGDDAFFYWGLNMECLDYREIATKHYEKYLKQYPRGKHVSRVQKTLLRIKETETP